VRLVSGPGCPVCVTPAGYIDQAVDLSLRPGMHVLTYGDLVRVPGAQISLEEARQQGAHVSVVYSAGNALEAARKDRDTIYVFLGVGFETTTPCTAAAIQLARREGLTNFTVLGAHKLIPPALQVLLEDESLAIDGFLAPGHVSVILGSDAYRPVAEQYRRPCVITGFDGVQMLMGMVRILTQLVADRPAVENVYLSQITPQGNMQAKELMGEMFRPVSSMWRGLGTIDASGLELRESYGRFDARVRFNLPEPVDVVPPGCQCGDVIKGILQPHECGLFGKACTPARPVGACMVSREGACRAFYRYRKVQP